MLRAAGDQASLGQNYGVSLIEWFELRQEVIIIMERPENSMNLREFIHNFHNGKLSEESAKVNILTNKQCFWEKNIIYICVSVQDVIRHLIHATQDMHEKGVFHRDIKCENILIQPTAAGEQLRIVDFGCGSLLQDNFEGIYKGV